jgi:hypothetical protein
MYTFEQSAQSIEEVPSSRVTEASVFWKIMDIEKTKHFNEG